MKLIRYLIVGLLILAGLAAISIPCLATVSSSTAFVQFTLTSNPQTLIVPFVFTNPGDLLVLDTRASAVPVTLILNSDYSVTGGAGSTGTVITATGGQNGVQVGDIITILRNVPLTQNTSFTNTGPLTASMIGQALDKLTMITQELSVQAGRALTLQQDETISPLLALSLRENKYLAFDGAGNILFTSGTTSTTPGSTGIIVNSGLVGPTGGGGSHLDGLDASQYQIGQIIQFTVGGVGLGVPAQYQLTTSAAATGPGVVAALNVAAARWIELL